MCNEVTVGVFGFNPLIGCPFDGSEMYLVSEWRGFKVGQQVEFRGGTEVGSWLHPLVRGEVIAIGENAKDLNGNPFVAFAIQVGNVIYFKTHREVWHVV